MVLIFYWHSFLISFSAQKCHQPAAAPAAKQHSPSFALLRTVNSLLIIVDIGEKFLIKFLKPRFFITSLSGGRAREAMTARCTFYNIHCGGTCIYACGCERGAAVQSAPTINQCSGQVWNLKIRRFDELAHDLLCVCDSPRLTLLIAMYVRV